SGSKWVAATLADGKSGYLQSTVKIFRIRTVVLAQSSVEVFESPQEGSKLKTTYKGGAKFLLAGLASKGEKPWIEIRSDSGDLGFIRAGAKVKDFVNADPQAANDQGLITGCAFAGGGLFFIANMATGGAVPGGAIGGAIGGGLGAVVGMLIVKARKK